jgi:hypothetical protein
MRGHWLWLVVFVLIVPILFESANAGEPDGVRVVQNYTTPDPGTSPRRLSARKTLPRCDTTAKLDLQSMTQKHSYDGYVHEPAARMIATRDGLWSHKISARLAVKYIREEPAVFVFRWYDPQGAVLAETEHVRPDRSGMPRGGHWMLYPIVDELEFKEMVPGKYTIAVEHPPGTLLVERSFNFYHLEQGPDAVARHKNTILFIVLGVVLMCLGIVTIRVLQ